MPNSLYSATIEIKGRTDNFIKAANQAARAAQETARRISQAGRQAVGASTGLNRMGDSVQKVTQHFSRFQQKLAPITNQLQRLSQIVGKIPFPAMAVGAGAAATAIGVMASGMVKAAKSAINFEDEMSKVATLLPDSAEKVRELGDELLRLSTEVGKPVGELAQGLYQVISAGVDAGEAIDVLRVASKAAEAGLSDIYTSVDGLTSVLNAYGASSRDAQRYADAFFAAIKMGKTTMQELAASVGRVAPLAAQLKIPFEDVAAALAVLTQSGASTAEAVTQLASLLEAVLDPSEQAKKLAEDLGIAWDTAALRSKGLAQFLSDVAKAVGDNDTALARLLGRKEGLLAFLTLGKQRADDFAEALKGVAGATGEMERAFERRTRTVQKQLDRLKAQWERLKIEMGELVIPVVLKVVTSANELFEDIRATAAVAAEGAKAEVKGARLPRLPGVPGYAGIPEEAPTKAERALKPGQFIKLPEGEGLRPLPQVPPGFEAWRPLEEQKPAIQYPQIMPEKPYRARPPLTGLTGIAELLPEAARRQAQVAKREWEQAMIWGPAKEGAKSLKKFHDAIEASNKVVAQATDGIRKYAEEVSRQVVDQLGNLARGTRAREEEINKLKEMGQEIEGVLPEIDNFMNRIKAPAMSTWQATKAAFWGPIAEELTWTSPVFRVGAAMKEAASAGMEKYQEARAVGMSVMGAAKAGLGAAASIAGPALAALAAEAVMATKGFQRIQAMLQGVFGKVVSLLEEVWTPLADALQPVLEMLGKLVEAFRPVLRLGGQWIRVLSPLIEHQLKPLLAIIELVGKALDALAKAVAWVANKLIDLLNAPIRMINGLREWMRKHHLGWLARWPEIPELKHVEYETPIETSPLVGWTQGVHISEITGPTRDILIDLLSPLSDLSVLPQLFDGLRASMEAMRRTVESAAAAVVGELQSLSGAFGGLRGAMKGEVNNIVVEGNLIVEVEQIADVDPDVLADLFGEKIRAERVALGVSII